MPKIQAHAKRLRIYIGEADSWEGKSLYRALVLKAKELDLAGASVFQGRMGYGANSRIHTASLIDLSADLPIMIEIIDSVEYIEKFLAEKELDLTATLDAMEAYSDADFVVIAAYDGSDVGPLSDASLLCCQPALY